MEIHAYAAHSAGASLQPFSFLAPELGPNDVEVKITHCGVCHSDIHLIDNDWKISHYPLVPGHEIVGVVAAKGLAVSALEIGQRVGIGWQSGSCQECEWCRTGEENMCPQAQPTCVHRPGGFAGYIRADGRFAFPIPDALESVNTAPLLCAGITVYAPLRRLGVTPATRVGVLGIGGLGHLALQFADAFGCHVCAISSSPSKENESLEFGADEFLLSSDKKRMKDATRSLDFILSTISGDTEWPVYLSLLRPNGTLCFVGATPSALNIPPMTLISGQLRISGSAIGSGRMMREMLGLAARHGISARTELRPMRDVNEAIARVRRNEARYRMVLQA